MNYTKSKERSSQIDEIKYPKTAGNTFSYPTKQVPQYKSYDKTKKDLQKDRCNSKNFNQLKEDLKQNDSLFKNMQKCNQKMQFYKLKGSLEEQKRSMLEQENYFLKTQNQQLKTQLENFKRQIKRLSKKVEKLSHQISKYQIGQNKFRINLPNKFKQNQNKSSNYQNEEHVQFCEQCIQLSQKLEQQRNLYQRDRKYLKQQIDNLNGDLEDAKRQQKVMKKQLQGRASFPQQKQLEIIQKFKNKQNQLKKQLTLCYQAFEQKCKLISQLQLQIDYFEQQNQRILKLLTLFDDNSKYKNQTLKRYENFPLKKQERSHSSYNVKSKNFTNLNYEVQKMKNNTFYQENIVQNRDRRRKCGSIKKVDIQ